MGLKLKLFLLVLLGLIVYYVVCEVLGCIRIQYYRTQNNNKILVKYTPFLLIILGFIKDTGKGDMLLRVKALIRSINLKENEKDVMISGYLLTKKAMIYPISQRAIKDFYKNEIACTSKYQMMKVGDFGGFFFKSGKEALHERNKLAELFHRHNLEAMIPMLKKVMNHKVNELKSIISTEQFTEKDLGVDVLSPLFEDVTNVISMGERGKHLQIDGMSLSAAMQKMQTLGVKANTNPLGYLPFARKLGLVSQVKKIKILDAEFKKTIRRLYEETNNNKESSCDSSILKYMLEFNQTVPEEKKMKFDEMVRNFQVLQLAAKDTSYTACLSILTMLVVHQDVQQKVREEIMSHDDYSTIDDLDKLVYLDCIFRETLRLYPVGPGISERIVTKAFKMGDVPVRKGDLVCIPIASLGGNELIFPDPEKFDPERFSKENKRSIPKMQLLPFSSGSRGCLGQVLAEITIKLFFIHFLKNFEIRAKEDWKPCFKMIPVYGNQNTKLLLKQINPEVNK